MKIHFSKQTCPPQGMGLVYRERKFLKFPNFDFTFERTRISYSVFRDKFVLLLFKRSLDSWFDVTEFKEATEI